MSISTALMVLTICILLGIFIYYDRQSYKAEMLKREKQREQNSQEWFEDLRQNHPEFYEAIVGKKEKLH